MPLVTRAERARDEMLLFYEAITRATERLYLSYPALDESAQPLLPSPFLGEVEEVFGLGAIHRVEQVDLSPVPLDDEPLSAAEFRVKAVATALEGNVALLAGLFGSRGERSEERKEKREGDTQNQPGSSSESLLPPPSSLLSLPSCIAAGLALLHSRQDRERFGPAEGVIRGDDARRLLAADYSAQRTFSATELERYASCPFRFLMERILKVEPIEDLSLEFDVLNRGRIVHDVLSRFHKNVNSRLGRPGSPLELDPAEFDSLMDKAIEKSLPKEPSNPLRAAMREIDRRLVVEWMAGYRDQCEKYDSQWKGFDAPPSPELFEVDFGRGGEEPPSTAEPLKFLWRRRNHQPFRPNRPRRCRNRRRPDGLQRARLQERRLDSYDAGKRPVGHDPATAALRGGHGGAAVGRPRGRPLASRILVRPRRRIQTPRGDENVCRERRPHRA